MHFEATKFVPVGCFGGRSSLIHLSNCLGSEKILMSTPIVILLRVLFKIDAIEFGRERRVMAT